MKSITKKLKEFAERIRLEAKQEIQAKDLEINHLKKDFNSDLNRVSRKLFISIS